MSNCGDVWLIERTPNLATSLEEHLLATHMFVNDPILETKVRDMLRMCLGTSGLVPASAAKGRVGRQAAVVLSDYPR